MFGQDTDMSLVNKGVMSLNNFIEIKNQSPIKDPTFIINIVS